MRAFFPNKSSQIVLFTAVLAALVGCTHRLQGNPKPVVLRTQDSKFATYSGSGKTVSIIVDNPRPGQQTTHFSEPPLRVIQKSGKTCEIESGNWSIDSFHLYHFEEILASVEYSGSNTWMSFYRTLDCKKISEIDLTDKKWKFSGNIIQLCDLNPRRPNQCRNRLRLKLPGDI